MNTAMDPIMSLRKLNMSAEAGERAADFYGFARALARAKGDLPLALRQSERGDASARVVEVLRSAVNAGTTTDANWASQLSPFRTISDGFVDALRSASCFDAMVSGGMVRVPMETRITMITSALAASPVNENMVTPLSSMSLDAPSVSPRKVVGVFAVTDEVVKFATTAAVLIFNSALRNSVAVASDGVFLPALVAATTPSGSSGTTVTAVVADLKTLLTAISPRANSSVFFVVRPETAVSLTLFRDAGGGPSFSGMTINGGTLIGGITCLVSDQLATNTALMVDATGLIGDPGQVVLDASREAALQLNTSPDSPESASTIPTSLFQHGLVAMRSVRSYGFGIARSSCIASLSSVNW